ncbi:uncharacterized protein N7515_005247 [Penicillium bovifimosum]|uniref:Shugoshin n=1 Tax=Penicillium bovifimosum TaxID=126998 RepID=A0A9W9GSR4_9EURO|nr:uncharacterized protein N7515_005247 [Penicillium bovifimosum]KAJ5129208.1 hypothetical protein N7515_005247 [Penicillium bovifimosum]
MARLNDYAAPAESIEALKRRFVRQNREIARVNSLQSLRIRSLESEVSHLLSENVSLRKQVITLTQETERLEAGKLLHNGIYDIKSRLEAKLADLSILATELGSLPRNVSKQCDKQCVEPKQTTESRPRTGDTMGGEDGRLPAIVEDKYYPRRTLEPLEIDNLVNDDHSILESPPQFTFMPEEAEEAETPIEHSSPSPPETTLSSYSHNDLPGTLLPPTLETRKKKRKSDSMIPPEMSPAPMDGEPSPSIDLTKHATSASTKRKYNPEDDDQFESNFHVEDEFQFTRPSHSPKKQTIPLEVTQRDQSPVKSHVQIIRGSQTPVLSMRKVLEPKSANANLSSPKKARMSSNQNSKIMQRSTKGDENTDSPENVKTVEKATGKTLGQKPRVSKVASTTKEKRTVRPASAQLEEPALRQSALSPHPYGSKSEEDSGARPSRRRGTVVSYAEPNLRDKMRRPTKEMIDAVAFGSRRSSSFQSGRNSLEGGENRSRSQSHDSLPALARAEQNADMSSGDGPSEQVLAMVSRRKRKVSSAPKDENDASDPSSGLKNEIENSLADISAQVSQEPSTSRRQTRRHSSNPKGATANMVKHDEPQSPGGDSPEDEDSFRPALNGTIDTNHARRGQRVAVRRKSMMV